MLPTINHRHIGDVPALEFYLPQAGRRVPLIIVMHGFTGRKEDPYPVCLSLAALGYYVTSIDLFLHGEAGPQPFDAAATAWRMHEVVERSCDYLDSLLTAYAQDSASLADPSCTGLMGISLGGAVIYRFLARNAQSGIQASGVRAGVALIAGLMDVWPETLRRAQPAFPALGVTEEMIEAAQQFLQANPPPPLLDGVHDFPLLMQYGQADPIIPIEAVRTAFRQTQHAYTLKSRLQLVEYPGIGHEMLPAMVTRAAEWFAQYLKPA